MKVYTMEVAWVDRQWSLLRPHQQAFVYAGAGAPLQPPAGYSPYYVVDPATGEIFWQPTPLTNWAINEWKLWGRGFKIPQENMKLMTTRWYLEGRGVRGYSSGLAETYAKFKMREFKSQSASGIGWVGVAFFVGALATIGVWWFVDYKMERDVTVGFNARHVLLRYEDRTWLAGLIARHSKNEWDFSICREDPWPFWNFYRSEIGRIGGVDYFTFGGLPQTLKNGVFGWTIYTWESLRCRFRGVAHRISLRRWRLKYDYPIPEVWDVRYPAVIPVTQHCEVTKIIGEYWYRKW